MDFDIPTELLLPGVSMLRVMRAIRIAKMNKTSTFCLFVPIFSQSLPQERAFCGYSSMAFAKDSAFYQIKHIKKDRMKTWKSCLICMPVTVVSKIYPVVYLI